MAVKPAAKGFTMVELIIVMLVAAVLSAIAMPRLTDRSALQERGAIDQMRAMLIHTRRLAITQGRDVCVLANPALARAVYVVAGACALASPVADPGDGSPYVLNAPPNVAIGGGALIRFNPRGQLVPAVNQLISVGTLTLTVQGETGVAI